MLLLSLLLNSAVAAVVVVDGGDYDDVVVYVLALVRVFVFELRLVWCVLLLCLV